MVKQPIIALLLGATLIVVESSIVFAPHAPHSHNNHKHNHHHHHRNRQHELVDSSLDSVVKVRESSDCVGYRSDLHDAEIVKESQIVRVYLDAGSQLISSASLIGKSSTPPTNSDKQSQDFDTHLNQSSSSTQEPQGGSTWSFTSSQAPQTTTTSQPPDSPQPQPVASKTARDGSAVFCGEANANGQSERRLLPDRIVGGRKSEPGEFPFQARLNIRSRRGSGICGGIVLDEQHILTAAHCMTSCVSQYLTTTTIETSGVLATIGDHSIRSQDGEQEMEIERITPHEKYDACNFYANDHDIALIKTATKINFRFTTDGYGSINRPCLPPNTNNLTTTYKDGETVIVSGWGVTRENSGTLSNILRYVQIPVVNNSQCQEVYGSRVTDSHVCAGFQAGGKDSCQGDSGGPLVRIVDNKYELVGIVSFGYGCAQPGAFGVYTRVASYLDWIKSNL